MRKRLGLVLLMLVGALVPTPGQAHQGHARPQITRFEFVQRPLKAGTLERLVVVAHDPNSWISEIQVKWEDADEMGGAIFAHTYCVQDPGFKTPGTPAKLKLDLEFDHAATYRIEARAISNKRCEAGNDTRISRTIARDIVVQDPTETFTDPDDIAGPLDVSSATHSQHADEAALRTHLTHALTFTEDLGDAPLAGSGDHVQFLFDTNDTSGTIERILTVDSVEGILRAEMTDSSGTVVGQAAVTTDGATLNVDFPKGLLRRGIGRYRWAAITHDASSTSCASTACDDRAPDSGLFSHNL